MSQAGFNNISYNAWQAAAQAALRGKNLDSLTKTTYDGIAVKPIYAASVESNQVALPVGAWQINQAINHPELSIAAEHIQQDLEQGVNGLSLYSNQSLNAHGYGVNLTQTNIDKLFKNTYLDMISLRLETGLDEFSAAEIIINHWQKHSKMQGQLSLGIDPIGKMTQSGGWDGEAKAKKSLQTALKTFKTTHILRVDGRIAHNAGASEAQELAYIIATATCYLKWADEAGLALKTTAKSIEICLSSTQNQFISMAKIRAMRQLWAELLDGLGIEPMPAYIFAETSYRMVSKSDPWINLLRATVACFAAGVGGANQISVLPLSAAIGLAPSFDRRLARHIQTILIEESHLAAVTDPAHGSAYVETLTTELVVKAWQLFQTIQKSGGIVTNVEAGTFQNQVAKVAAKRDEDLASHKQELTGTSIFRLEDEEIYQTLDMAKTNVEMHNFNIKTTPLKPKRDAEMFEAANGGV